MFFEKNILCSCASPTTILLCSYFIFNVNLVHTCGSPTTIVVLVTLLIGKNLRELSHRQEILLIYRETSDYKLGLSYAKLRLAFSAINLWAIVEFNPIEFINPT